MFSPPTTPGTNIQSIKEVCNSVKLQVSMIVLLPRSLQEHLLLIKSSKSSQELINICHLCLLNDEWLTTTDAFTTSSDQLEHHAAFMCFFVRFIVIPLQPWCVQEHFLPMKSSKSFISEAGTSSYLAFMLDKWLKWTYTNMWLIRNDATLQSFVCFIPIPAVKWCFHNHFHYDGDRKGLKSFSSNSLIVFRSSTPYFLFLKSSNFFKMLQEVFSRLH